MEIRYFQKGFNYSEDGTGNRLVIHLQGCNLHCPWCSNPEGMTFTGGEKASIEELAEEIISSKRLFFDGGGVTFSGGECTVQKEALKALFPLLKKQGINIAVETNGTLPYEEDFFENIDLLIADCKHYDEEKLSERVGQVRGYRENIANYLRFHHNLLICIPLIASFNAETDKKEVAYFIEQVTGHLIPDFKGAIKHGVNALQKELLDKAEKEENPKKKDNFRHV